MTTTKVNFTKNTETGKMEYDGIIYYPSHMLHDKRVMKIRCYLDGWVANSYKWKCEGYKYELTRRDDGNWNGVMSTYDRKRSNGTGPKYVAFSEKGGRLYSES